MNKLTYSAKGKNGIKGCYNTLMGENVSKSYKECLREYRLNEKLEDVTKRILIARENEDIDKLFMLRSLMTTDELVNILIYDIQATGVPKVIITDSGESILYPAIIQISFYHPKTGRHFSSYVKPHSPITSEVTIKTGIFNSFNMEFTLPFFPEECDPRAIEDMYYLKYSNQVLASNLKVLEIRDDIQAKNIDIDEDMLLELAINRFLEEKANDVTKFISLDEIDEENGLYMFYEIIDNIFQIIDEGVGKDTTTLLIAHNGSNWAEPIFKAELERMCASDQITKNMLFIDSKYIMNSIFSKLPGSNDVLLKELDQILGEERQESFNTHEDVISLWNSIRDVFRKIFETDDWNFIASKFAEEIYVSKLY